MSVKEVLERARQLGSRVSRDTSTIDPATTERLRAQFWETPAWPPDGWHTAPARAADDGGSGDSASTSVLPPPVRSGSTGRGDGATVVAPSRSSEERRAGATGDRGSRIVAQITELPLLVLLAFVIAVVIKTFFLQAFFIPSGSMLPTLHNGDRVLVEKLSYRFGDPARGDVVVFAKSVFGGNVVELPWYLDVRNFLRELLGLPTGSETDYIKRVVAVAGDTVRYAGRPRRLVVNGTGVREPYIRGGRDRFSPSLLPRDCRRLGMKAVRGGCLVPEGRVFVMGDNRSDSEDSRVIGPVRESKIVGHAFVIIWPPDDISPL